MMSMDFYIWNYLIYSGYNVRLNLYLLLLFTDDFNGYVIIMVLEGEQVEPQLETIELLKADQ